MMLSCLLVSSVIGMTQQPSQFWVELAKAGHDCAEGKCCSETDPELPSKCACGPCDIATPPSAAPLTLPDATKDLKRPDTQSEFLLTTPIHFSSLNWSPPVPPPKH